MSTYTGTQSHGHATRTRRFNPLGWLLLALEARRQRKALRSLPQDRLADLGISPEAARREAEMPIWNVPAHWLR